ncbi:hypothetical protein [Tessaracoccus lacteus]|uniref:Uncharacterized protein n=1 Tax=Tessaracoccus lacteus TaxID=3041766 RepID=A0ABY8PXL5_9ACTN|nr:hypothetical protein [Tessaracoccus sp. T21]WGT47223.1 hypothetical protein QH948_00045 [Tessaracoccus sp. T21]
MTINNHDDQRNGVAWPALEHSAQCRKPDMSLRLDWQQHPELWCRSCGRHQLIRPHDPINPQEDQ